MLVPVLRIAPPLGESVLMSVPGVSTDTFPPIFEQSSCSYFGDIAPTQLESNLQDLTLSAFTPASRAFPAAVMTGTPAI